MYLNNSAWCKRNAAPTTIPADQTIKRLQIYHLLLVTRWRSGRITAYARSTEIRARENNDKHENIVGRMLEILSWVDIIGPSKCLGIVIVPIVTGSVNTTRRSTTAKFIRRPKVFSMSPENVNGENISN